MRPSPARARPLRSTRMENPVTSTRVLHRTLLALAALTVATSAHAQTKLLRFPAINGDRVAFTYAGDLWTASAAGGAATRLTAHPGIEVFAQFSPDGKWLAFTGQYDGDEQVYVVPSNGGVPKQLTFYPARGPLTPRWGWENRVYGWTPDGKRIVFRSGRDSWAMSITRLYTVAVGGGPCRTDADARKRARAISPPTVRRWSIRRSSATSARRSATAAAWPTISSCSTRRPATPSALSMTCAPTVTRCGSAARSTSTESDRTGTFNLYAYDLAT